MIRNWSHAHPRTTAWMIVAIVAAVLVGPVIWVGPVDATNGTGHFDFDALTGGVVFQAILSVFLIAVMLALGWRHLTAFANPLDSQGWRAFLAIAIYPAAGLFYTITLINADPGGDAARDIIMVVLVLNVLVGLSEELLFRGFLFGALRQKHRLITAILLSSLAFGLIHFVNAVSGQSLEQTLFQVISTTALGLLFCALVLQCNSLWPAIAVHMLWNSFVMMGLAASEARGEMTVDVAAPDQLSLLTFMLPICVTLIAVSVLRNYTRRTGVRLRDVVPTTPPNVTPRPPQAPWPRAKPHVGKDTP